MLCICCCKSWVCCLLCWFYHAGCVMWSVVNCEGSVGVVCVECCDVLCFVLCFVLWCLVCAWICVLCWCVHGFVCCVGVVWWLLVRGVMWLCCVLAECMLCVFCQVVISNGEFCGMCVMCCVLL